MNAAAVLVAIGILIVIVIGVGYGAYFGVEFLSVQWGSLSNDWKAILIVIGSILVVCSFYISLSLQSAMKKSALRGAGQMQAYNAFLDWYSVLKEDRGISYDLSGFKMINNRMALWAGKKTFEQVESLYEALNNDSPDPEQLLELADKLYMIIARELGHGDVSKYRKIV